MKLMILIFKSILSIIFFTITITIAIILFMDIDKWGNIFYKKMGYKVSEKFLGGYIIGIIDNGDYYTRIHKPVFDGFFLNNSKGFIQIDWLYNKELPSRIFEEFDCNNDGILDFAIDLFPSKEKARLIRYNDKIINFLDKTSMGLLNLRGFDDGRYSIFTYHDYQEPIFLDYNKTELESIDLIKKIVLYNDQENLNDFLNNVKNREQNKPVLCNMKRKFEGIEKVKISFKKELDNDGEEPVYMLNFKVTDIEKQEELSIVINDYKNLLFGKVLPMQKFKFGNSLRVIIKK